MQFDLPFVHLIFIGFLSLFPAVNPVGSAFIVDPLLNGLNLQERKKAAKKVALYCLAICTVSALIGSWILKLFGISIPIVQLAGGIMICRMGWQLLTSDDDIKGKKETAQPDRGDIENLLFYPVAFPMTTGAGTISVLLTLSAHENEKDIIDHVMNLGALFIAIVLMCGLIYICYANAPRLIHRLGPRGEQIVNRLSAFLVFCIGMQIASAGIRSLLKA
jgi:multiple antibiotic resistance protein